MFSNETAVGVDPVKVVRTAVRIVEETEKSPLNDVPLKRLGSLPKSFWECQPIKKRKSKHQISKRCWKFPLFAKKISALDFCQNQKEKKGKRLLFGAQFEKRLIG